MISWIQRSFQHHFRIIFAVLLAITIISFIMTIGAAPGIGRGDHQVLERKFFGYNLESNGDMQAVFNDAALSIDFELGYSGLDPEQVRNYALERVAALHLADEWHIPAGTPDEQVAFIKGLPRFTDSKTGQFDANSYDSYRAGLQTGGRATEQDIARVLNDDLRIHKVRQLLDGPGYVLPADVKSQLARTDTSWTIDTATVDATSFHPTINPTDAQLAKYFQDNASRYEIPARTVALAVDYPAADYLNQIKVTDADVRSYYNSKPEQFPAPAPKGGAAVKVKPDPAADFAAVRPQVEAALKLDRAKQRAAKAASDLAYNLYEAKVTAGPSTDAYLAAHKLTPRTLAPFTAQAGPAELGGSPEIADVASKLDAEHSFSDAVTTPTGAAILFWHETLPARKPLLSEVRAKVLADYVENEKHQRFADLGKTLRAALESRLKAGDSFEKAVAAAATANAVKIEAKVLPAFTFRSRPADLNPSVAGALEHLEKGQVSDLVVEGDKGYLVYAADKKVPDLKEGNPQYRAMLASLASYESRSGSDAYLNEMVGQEMKRSEPAAN